MRDARGEVQDSIFKMQGARCKILASCVLGLASVGCVSTPREVVRRVEVPVAVPCPAPLLPPRPHLPLADLPADASAADIARATAASLEALTGYARAIETAVAP